MRHVRLWVAAGWILLCVLGIGGMVCNQRVQAAITNSGMVSGVPAYRSACGTPEDVSAGGYADAVIYNDRVCNGKSSTWQFKNGYVFWSTRAKAAANQKTTLYRSIGWDITFSADLNGNNRIDSDEKITISVARTINGAYLPQMNYYYINYQEKETDGQLYKYSLYAMSYDRLQELAANHEAAEKGGKTPVTTAIFHNPNVNISIDAIMTTVERDAYGNETLNGAIRTENGTGASAVRTDATGSVTTSGTVYHCNDPKDYGQLVERFNEASISTYRNSGTVHNYRLKLEFYVDKKMYDADGSNGWSIREDNGQIYYKGKPYTQSISLWETTRIPDLKEFVSMDGYRLTGSWRCGDSACYVNEQEIYHTTYLAQYADYPRYVSNIFEGNGVLRLYADSSVSWKENEYRIEYYSKAKENQSFYQKVATQICQYGQEYRIYDTGNTSAPDINGVELLYWTQGVEPDAKKISPGTKFSGRDFSVTKGNDGKVIKLYAVWGVQSYTITCKKNCPVGKNASQYFYEIYGLGFTMDATLAATKTSTDPFFWKSQGNLTDTANLNVQMPKQDGYIWNGFWDKKVKRQYITPDGKILFDSAKTFEADTTIYGDWRKNYTLTVMYRLGDAVSIQTNESGYGMDSNGFLTVKGKTVTKQYLATDTVTVQKIPDCIERSGCTRPSKWQIEDTGELVLGGGSYSAKVLAKKAGGNLDRENVTAILQLPWSEFPYYVDYYFKNASTGKYEIKASQQCRYGKNYRFYSEQQAEAVKTPADKVFKGWSTTKGSSRVDYPAKTVFCNLAAKENQRVRLYAVWGSLTAEILLSGNCPADSQNPVAMGSNGIRYVIGEGFIPEDGTQIPHKNCKIRIPTCEGYVFTGFFDAQKGGTQMVDPTGAVTSAMSVEKRYGTFYAQWEQKTYRITCHANGGRYEASSWGNEQTISRAGVIYGNFLPAMIAPKRNGYSFDGYRRSGDDTDSLWYNRFLNSGNRRYCVAYDVELYAEWKDDIAPSGTIRANGGNSAGAWVNRDIQLTVSGSDAGSGIVKMELFCKRYFESSYRLLRMWETAPVPFFEGTMNVDMNGISSFYCVTYDAAGNTNYRISGTASDFRDTKATVLYVDKIAPRATTPKLGDVRIGDTSVNASVYASDDVLE